jgi:molybdopterin-guanine dinucleotide biosynthesis protein A
MGRDKAWLNVAGKPLIAHAINKARALGAVEVFISGRADTDYTHLHCPVLLDREPGCGPLGGVERGLDQCAAPLLLVLAVDLPKMTLAFLGKLWQHCDESTGAVPFLKGEAEPLAAFYPKRCQTIVTELITSSRYAAREFVQNCECEGTIRPFVVSREDAECFANCNTALDYAASLERARKLP